MFKNYRERVEAVDFKERVPPVLRPFFRWVHRRIRTATEYHAAQGILVKNRPLKTRFPNSGRCFIVGNGPSVKQQDLTLLRGETTFVMNSFFLHADYERIRPTFHCAVDPVAVAGTESNLSWLRDFERHGGDTTLLFSIEGHELFRRHGLFANRNVHFILHSDQGCDTGRIHCDLTRPLPGVACVTLSCILTACYMGFREVYLLGCDHDWLGTPSMVNHFYDKNPHYSESIAMYPYETLLETTLSLWRSYRRVREFALGRGTRIYNATRGGFLDVFPRVEYESLVSAGVGQPASPALVPGSAGGR